VNPEEPDGEKFDFRGGSTLIFDMEGESPSLRYAITRPIDDKRRLEAIQAYKRTRGEQQFSLGETYFTGLSLAQQEPFCFLHGGN
jgi:hypothetical protein